MNRKFLTMTLTLVLLLVLAATASAQDRVGEPKGEGLSLQSIAVDNSLTPTQMAQSLVGADVTLSNITYTGNPLGSGAFSGGAGNVGLEDGVILSSGLATDATGPNTSDSLSVALGSPGDSDLNGLIPGFATHDATILEFDFECPSGAGLDDVISFRYVFSSEEYNEWVNSIYNDVFGFFLNGTNIALLPDGVTPVAINNVNNGYSASGGLPGSNPSNPTYYRNNDLNDGGPFIDIEPDGLTVVLGAEANINSGVNHMKLAIADAGDTFWDSWVFIEGGSFQCAPLNQPPTADPNGPYMGAAGSPIAFDGSGSSDPDGDPLTYNWQWGDGSGATDAGATPTHSYAAADIYDVCLTVNDGVVDSETVCTYVVVYDPSAGFVTGGGWIDSPADAYKPDPTLTGKANFGFVSKYKKGAETPAGNTEFQFHAGDLNFHSQSYQWLVVTGSDYAMFKGTGTVDGMGEYKFRIWAGDSAPDTFRIKIWEEDGDGNETVLYDNGGDQAIGGGSIVIHTKN